MSTTPTTPTPTAATPTPPGDLVLTERIRATPDQVFDFLVEPEKLLRSMGTEAKIDPTPGGDFWLNVNGENIAVGKYVAVERPHRVVLTWGWQDSPHVPPGSTEVTFTLTADGDETVVELVHAGLPLGPEDEHKDGWTYFLDRMCRAVAGEQLPAPGPH